MAVVIYTNKKTGVRTAYESESYWVPELKQPRSRRKYLGRVDDDGNIIPSTGRRGRKAGTRVVDKDEELDEQLSHLRELLVEKDKEIAALQKENKKLRKILSDTQKTIQSGLENE